MRLVGYAKSNSALRWGGPANRELPVGAAHGCDRSLSMLRTTALFAGGFAFARLIPLVALLLLTGCNILGTRSSEPVVAYSPDVEIAAGGGASVDWQLVVARPSAENMLSGPRIAVRSQGELQVLKGARWTDPAPELLQGLIVRALEDSGRILGVGRQSSGLRGDFALALDLRAFEAVYAGGGAPTVEVVFNAKLLSAGGNRALASRTFSTQVPARGREAGQVVAAFEGALQETVAALVDWVLQQGEEAAAAAPAPAQR